MTVACWATSVGAQTPTVNLGGDADEVLATVGELPINRQDVERRWQSADPTSFARLRQQVYELQRRAIDDLVAERLLEREAAKRELSVEQLLSVELPPRTRAITDDDVREAYDRMSGGPSSRSLQEARKLIVPVLERQLQLEARRQYVQELRGRAGSVSVHLAPPRHEIKVQRDDPAKGTNSSDVVEIIEFGDFQCPYCSRVAPILDQLLGKYADRIRVIWKDFPLQNHPDAARAAEAAQCAREQGAFWPYHDRLFAQQNALKRADLRRYANEIGLDVAAFAECLDSSKYFEQIMKHTEEGRRAGVSSTPTIFINGRIIPGAAPFEVYEAIVLEELARPDVASSESRD